MPPPSSSMRRRRRKGLAAAAAVTAAALVLCLSSAHAEGAGLRGGGGGQHPLEHSPQNEQYQQHEYQESELPLADELLGDEDMPVVQEERTLANQRGNNNNISRRNNNDDDNEVTIEAFTTNLLATNFPYELKYQAENQLSGAVSTYLASYLSDAIDETVVNLGLDCTKDKQRIGPELRWVLACEGAATFDTTPNKKEFNDAVHQAFMGTAKNQFLEKMYPQYEMIHEKKEWDYEQSNRLGRKRQKKTPGNGKKKKKNQKNKKQQKNKKPQKKQQEMKPNSGQQQGNSQVNVMGYVSGSQQMNQMASGEKGYAIINGNIHVYIDDDTKGNNGSKNKPSKKDKPDKMQMQQGNLNAKPQSKQQNKPNKKPQSKPQNKPKPKQQSSGGTNVMGYASGSKGKNKDDGPKGYDIKGGDIHVTIDDDKRERKRRRNK